jgi:N-methylhydantoinase A
VSTALHDAKSPASKRNSKGIKKTSRTVFDPVAGKRENIPQVDRAALAPGARLAGPALVAEPQTTTLVPRGWSCRVTAASHLLLERRA